MPVQSCSEGGKSGYRWGNSGKCYTYPAGDEKARKEAKRKAVIQGIAAGERPSASAFNAAVSESYAASERSHLPALERVYEQAIREAARPASALTAAPDWQPPPEGALLTASELAALSAALNEKLQPIWVRIVLDAVNRPLATIEISFDVAHPIPARLLQQAAQRTGARLGEAVQFILRETIAKAYAEGLPVESAAALIRAQITAAAPWQAEMLARTDLNSLANGASKAAAAEVGMGFKTWLATLDDKTRPEHVDAHGQTVPMNDTFLVGGEDADYPGDPALSDAMAANCFPAGTLVAGSVDGAFRAPYSGELVTVMTRRGRKLAGTPNHPVLTTTGWKALALLNEGDHLICAGFEHRPVPSTPDVDQAPSPIEEVFTALKTVSDAQRIAGRDVDFHGDVADGDVDVVRTDGLLELPCTPSGFKPSEHLSFAVSDAMPGTFANQRLRMKGTGRVLGAAASGVREPRQALSFVGSHALHTDRLSFGDTPTWDATLIEPPLYDLASRTKPHGDLLLADLFVDVEANDLVDINLPTRGSEWDASLFQPRCGGLPSGSREGRNLLQTQALGIETDEVVSLDLRPWSGQVFTLSTEQGYYIANEVVSRNCRCTSAYSETLEEANGLLAAGLPADEGSIIMGAVGSRRERMKRKAARHSGSNLVIEAGENGAPDRVISLGALVAAPRSIRFSGDAAVEGILSDDSTLTPRALLPESLDWPEMPQSFYAQIRTDEGHMGAEIAGRVDSYARKRGKGRERMISIDGEFTNEFGVSTIAPMVEDRTMRFVSVDLGAVDWAFIRRETFEIVAREDLSVEELNANEYALGIVSAKIKATTLVGTQALPGASIALVASADGTEATVTFPVEITMLEEGEALIASPAPRDPPRAWFETQEPPGKMPLTVLKDGRVYGHLAAWDSCHASFLPQCVPPPRSPSNYARFHTAYIDTAEGDELTVGKLMFSPTNGGHADRRLSASKASAYYDKTGMAAAYLRAVDGQYGIWVAGALNPAMTDEQREEMRRELRLNPPSGDWRVYDGQYDLLCGLAVAVPGFGVIPSAEVSIIASADGVELQDAIIASSGWFDPDPSAVAAMEKQGLLDEEILAERTMRALVARSEGMDALAALVD